MPNTLTPGQVRVGHIVDTDADDGHPWQAAALTFDERRGAELLVPFVRGEAQFAKTDQWFRTTTPPEKMLFGDGNGVVTFVGMRWLGDSGGSLGTGRLGADVVVFAQPRKLKDEYRVRTLRSTIDGLDGFTGFRPVRYVFPTGDEPAVIKLDTSETVTWRSNGFTYALRAGAQQSGVEGRHFEAISAPYIATSCSRGRTPQEHLRAHWAIRDLLLFAHGRTLAWRSHRIVDDQFPLYTVDGTAHAPRPVETHFVGTVSQHALPEPSSTSLAFPELNLKAIGKRGLKRWTDLYADDTFRRAVQPVAEVINGAASFLEPQLMMLAAALDYFGYYRYGGGSRGMRFSIEKCLDDAELDWPEIGSRRGIASAIACMNNDLKHPDRQTRPDSDALASVTALARIIARAQIFDILGVNRSHLTAFLRSSDGRRPAEMFKSCRLAIGDDGTLIRTP